MSTQEVTQREKEIIIMYWKSNKNNSIREIAQKFGFTEYVIHGIINRYLDGIKKKDN